MATPAELPEQLARRVTSWKTIAVAAAALVSAGLAMGGVVFGSRYVSAGEYREHLRAFEGVKSTVDADHAVIQYIHDDLEDIKAQDAANARAVGAPVLTRSHGK